MICYIVNVRNKIHVMYVMSSYKTLMKDRVLC